MKDETARHAQPGPRRWRGVALAATALAVLGAGIATANAATAPDPRPLAAPQDPTRGAKGVAGLVNAADAFLGTLSDGQKSEVLLDLTEENATAWSNLPCAGTCRPGIELGTLTAEQLTAAETVLRVAAGTGQGTGFDQIRKIMAADDLLAADSGGSAGPGDGSAPSASGEPAPAPSGSGGPPAGGGGGAFSYGSGFYYLAFLGTPSVTGTWQLNFGGHHLAVHLTYEKGRVTGASPFFLGVEPISYTDSSGATVEAMAAQKNSVAALAASLTTKQMTAATMAESFGDVLVGPQKDGQFPATKEGVPVKTFSPGQKRLVLDAIKAWVSNSDDASARQLLKIYESELDRTVVGISGGTGYETQGDYLRIDGPSVWIEFVCQNGVVYRDQIHYHTVYRDHTRDYGGEFSF
ncbi:DUF3500 domain-containing protein [Actinoplanes regularis]|uniref:DUF3500 domain-containing protein n=1 Tax=Actinoplanes regularis TaxID=52697 RepID=A0A238W8F8_9ACTN|nr:DUF3500 domain-containing protein [Actinoplanes regularis]GIE85188.1 hypothetical protein Are01nite_16680 [Actinoplanes regularis]SNR42493.1 Protein of unknown function [Actinoplanes regularis]